MHADSWLRINRMCQYAVQGDGRPARRIAGGSRDCLTDTEQRPQRRTARQPFIQVAEQHGGVMHPSGNDVAQSLGLAPPLHQAETEMRHDNPPSFPTHLDVCIDGAARLSPGWSERQQPDPFKVHSRQQHISVMAMTVAHVRTSHTSIFRRMGQQLELRAFIEVIMLPIDLLKANDIGVDFADHSGNAANIPPPVTADGAMNIVCGDAQPAWFRTLYSTACV